jgi:hypothetical protein
MLPHQDKKFAHPGEASGHTGKRKSESPHACSMPSLKSVTVDRFSPRAEAKPLKANTKTNPHRTPDLYRLSPMLPLIGRTKGDVSFHTLCTFDADKSRAILSETPTVKGIMCMKAVCGRYN